MKIIKADPLDGKQPIKIIVDDADYFRMASFISDARDLLMQVKRTASRRIIKILGENHEHSISKT